MVIEYASETYIPEIIASPFFTLVLDFHLAMQKALRRIRKYGTFVLLCTSILLLIQLGLFQREFFTQIAEILREFIWPAIIAVSTLFGFVTGGVIKNPPKSFSKFLENGLLQIAVFEFSMFLFGLSWYTRPGQIELKLASGGANIQIKALSVWNYYDIRSIDTIRVPSAPHEYKPGKYTFRIIEKNYYESETPIDLGPGEKKTVIVEDRKISATLIVNTNPAGAEIWIDGFLKGHTPHTLRDLERKRQKMDLKLTGFQPVTRTLDLADTPEADLGTILLLRLYKIKFLCAADDIEFTINDRTYKGTQKEVFVPEGTHIMTIKIPGYPPQPKNVDIKGNQTIYIP